MILEQPTINLVAVEIQDPDTEEWEAWSPSASSVAVVRGGKPSGISATVDVGTFTVTLVNSGDPLTNGALAPNLVIRLVSVPGAEEIYTGRITDISTEYALDKKSGKLTTYVTLVAADAVAGHVNTNRYGAITAGGAGFESWALRIARLATSSVSEVTLPADDAPIVRYAI